MDSVTMTTEQQLPKGWTKYRVSDIGISMTGNTPSTKKEENYGKHLPFIKPPELSNSRIFTSETYLSTEGAKVARILPENSILISCIGNLGKVGINIKPVAFNQQINAIIPNKIVNPLFLFYQAQSIFFKNQLEEKSSATTISIVNKTSFESIYVYIPPLETQQAIVNKIESLFDEIDEGIGRLKTAAQQIQQYRQSLLKNAFNGELTKEWRSKHADTLPSENELLAQIQTTREQHHAQQLADWQTAVSQWEQNGKEGKKPSKPSTLKKLESIEKLNEIELTELPDGWFWERLGLMTLGVEYGTSAKSQPEGKVPVLRMGNMQNGKIDWTDLVYSDNDEEIKQYSLKKGDVLFNRTNSPELVGKTSIIETDEKAIFAGYLIRINHLTEITDGRYLTYFLNSMIAKKYGNFVKTDGVNQSNINGQKLINYPFVFCSLEEQKEVANILEQKLTACDQLAAELAKQLKQAELLKQTVLKAAFSGSLLDK